MAISFMQQMSWAGPFRSVGAAISARQCGAAEDDKEQRELAGNLLAI